MNFAEFQNIVSQERLQRYLIACGRDEDKTIHLYKENVNVSLEIFAVVGAFEIALRNAIDRIMTEAYGNDWLRDAILPGGIFDIPQCRDHARIIRSAYEKMMSHGVYSHGSLLAKMEFGVWKYMFSSPQYRASGRLLLSAFPLKPTSTRNVQYNNTTIFNELDHVNSLRNRIAHHEPICFPTGFAEITTDYIRWIYSKIMMLFEWMNIDSHSYLSGLDHVMCVCDTIDELKRHCKR